MAHTSVASEETLPRPAEAHRRSALRGLQALRGIAAVMIVLAHSGQNVEERLHRPSRFSGPATLGVDIFFALSGFVMIYSSLQPGQQKPRPLQFIERRIIRIVPLYWVATTLKLIALAASPKLSLHTRLSGWSALASYLFLPVRNADQMFRPLLGVGWTLNYEMFFYVLFTLAIASRLALIPTLGTVLIALAMSSYFHAASGPAILFYSDSIVLDFLWGMVAAWLFSKKKKSIQWYEAAAVMLVGWVILFTPTPFRPTIGIGAGLIVYGVVLLERYLQSLPYWMIYLGEGSYAIYLFQSLAMPLLPITMARMHVSYVGVAVAGGVLLGVAAGCAAHECLELPIMRYLKSHVEKGARPHIPLEPVISRKP